MSFTLLTFANSFPDMVTSILMAETREEGPYLSLAGLMATYMFQTTVTIAFVIFSSDYDVEVSSKFFIKEIVTICVICSTFFVFGMIGYISGIIMIFFLIFYLLYFILGFELASNSQTKNFEQFIDIEENNNNDDSQMNSYNYKRNIILAKKEPNNKKKTLSKITLKNKQRNMRPSHNIKSITIKNKV